MPLPEPVASGSGTVTRKVAPEETAAKEGPSKPRSPLPFHDKGLEEAPAEMPDLETEQEAAVAQQRSQPTPEVQQGEVSVQQEKDTLDQLHEIRWLANLAQVTTWQDNQIFTVTPEEGVLIDWRLYEEVLAEDMESIRKAMGVVAKTQEEVCFHFLNYVSSWVLEGGYAAVVTQQWGMGKSRVNDLLPPALTVVFWYVQLLDVVGAVFRMVKQTYAVDPRTKKKEMVCITYAAVNDLTFAHEVEQRQ